MSSFKSDFRTETWTLYSVGLFIIVLRLTARIRKLGIQRLQADDWAMIQGIVWYTLLVVSINRIIFGGGSNFMTPEEVAALTPETRQDRIVGSKWVLVSEQSTVLTIWTCKLCMLFIYRRMTGGSQQAKLINLVFIWVVAGFIGTQIAIFTNCRPFEDYWSVPPASNQCWSYYNYAIIEAIFNISADILMLLVAIPMLFKTRIPLQQKAVLLTIFGMGTFVIIAAILTKVYALYPPLISYSYLNWYFREASVCIYVTNLPAIWSLLRDVFPFLTRWGYQTQRSSGARSAGVSRSRIDGKSFTMQRLGSANGDVDGKDDLGMTPTQSQTRIIQHGDPQVLEINTARTFSVQQESISDDDLEAAVSTIHDNTKPGHSRTNCTAV